MGDPVRLSNLMALNLEQASQAVLSLPLKERATLAHVLIHSLDEAPDSSAQASWNEEIDRRLDRLEIGETESRDAFEVLDEIRQKYANKD